MRYHITRTSDSFGEKQPCKNAVCARKYSTDKYFGYWYIEINSIPDLQELISEVGRIIIDDDSIEIYDDYRE